MSSIGTNRCARTFNIQRTKDHGTTLFDDIEGRSVDCIVWCFAALTVQFEMGLRTAEFARRR